MLLLRDTRHHDFDVDKHAPQALNMARFGQEDGVS
jgi:hypothetical protein